MEKVKNLNCSTRKFENIRNLLIKTMIIRNKIEIRKSSHEDY